MKSYDRLEFVGRAKYIQLCIYPSTVEVKIYPNAPYKFKKGDILNAESVAYYNSMYDRGLRLIESGNESIPVPPLNPTETPMNQSDVSDITTGQESHDPQFEEESSTMIPPVNDLSEDSVDDQIPNDTVVDNSTSIVNREELVEFIDLNYDDEALSALAREVGASVRSNWSRDTIINKIIDANTEHIVNLVKNS